MSLPVIPATPRPETKSIRQSPAPKSTDRDFPRSLQSAVQEPRSATPDPLDTQSRPDRSSELTQRGVAPGERREPISERAALSTPDAGSAVEEPEVNSEEPIPMPQEPVNPAEQAPQLTSALALVVEATGTQDVEIDLTDSQVESGDLLLAIPTAAEFVDDEMLSQASVLDLEGLAQFLDAVPTRSSETVQSLAEIVAQFLTNGPDTESDEVVVEGVESVPVPDDDTPDAGPVLLIPTTGITAVDAATVDAVDAATVDTVDAATVDTVVASVTAEVPSAPSAGPTVVAQEAVSVVAAELSKTSPVEPEALVRESSVAVAEAAGPMQISTDQPASGVQSPEGQSVQTVQAQGASETPSSLGQDDPQSGPEEQAQEAAKPQVSISQALETPRPGSDVTQQVRVEQSATPQVVTQAQRGEGTAAESIGRAAVRLVERIEALRNAPPPRSMVLELTELEGTRVRVSLDGNVVRMTVMDGSLDQDAREQLDRELNQALAQQGFDLANSSEEQRERWEEAQERGETLISGQRRIRRPQATGLRL